MIGRVALLVTFKKINQNHKAYHEVIYVTWRQFEMQKLGVILLGLLFTACSAPTVKESKSTDTTSNINPAQTSELIIGERIDGPANIRDTINGRILFELNDQTLVETTPTEHDWLGVGVFVKVTEQQVDAHKILPETEIYSLDGQIIGTSKDTVNLWMANKRDSLGFIGGVTFKDNIRPETVPEKVLVNLLEQKSTSKTDLNDFIANFQFTDYDLNDLPGIEQMFIYQTWLVDVSPRDRITLLIRKDDLIGVCHSRDLPTTSFKTYELIRGHKLTITSDLTDQEIEEIRKKRIHFYNSVD